jgi:hypothetical protein
MTHRAPSRLEDSELGTLRRSLHYPKHLFTKDEGPQVETGLFTNHTHVLFSAAKVFEEKPSPG